MTSGVSTRTSLLWGLTGSNFYCFIFEAKKFTAAVLVRPLCRETLVKKIDGSDSSKDFLLTVCLFFIHNLQIAGPKMWRVRWSHANFGACKE